jgi:hypothetical protein
MTEDSAQDVGKVHHRKSSPIENLGDAFGLVEWFASILKDEMSEPILTPFYIQVEISIRPMGGGNDAQ